MTEEKKHFKIGSYGTGTLWVLHNRDGLFILFNSQRIAKRVQRKWLSLEQGWRVTPEGSLSVRVQLNDSDGVVVPLNGGGNRK
jgi:hypothetical protein